MPARNVKKEYRENSYYHLYNQGPSGSPIFHEPEDYEFMLQLLKKYLDSDSNINLTIDLVCFCLMPNHFHFLVYQKSHNGITQFTRRLLTSYAMYFMSKYKKHGSLFEGKLKGVLIDGEPYLLHLSRYIHRHPLRLLKESESLRDYPHSSYPNYLGHRTDPWIKTDDMTRFFQKARKGPLSKVQSFIDFTEKYAVDSAAILGSLTLDESEQ